MLHLPIVGALVMGDIRAITGFSRATDAIRTGNAAFTSLAADRIISETGTGKLLFLHDGTGWAATVYLAAVATTLALLPADFALA